MIRLVLVLMVLALPAMADFMTLTTDFSSTGGVTSIQNNTPWNADIDVEQVSGDAVARWHNDLYYVVNRTDSNIQVIDPSDWSTVMQVSVGVGKNPQDIAFAPNGTVWVSCYDATELLQLDPVTLATVQSYSTAEFADADGFPETSWITRVNDRLYILNQRLDRNNYWGPVDYSQLIVFDTITENWVDVDAGTAGTQGILLNGTNPFCQPEPREDGTILVGTTGFYGSLDGGIELVDTNTLTSNGFIITEADLGNDLLDFADADGYGYVVISNDIWGNDMLRYEGATVETVLTSSGWDYSHIVIDGSKLLLCDRAYAGPGVRVFEAISGTELTTSPIATGLPPFMIALPEDGGVTDVPAAIAELKMRAPWPNPANPSTSFSVTAPNGTVVKMKVLDMRGRVVRSESVTAIGETASWSFNGLNDSGTAISSGIYRCVAISNAGTATRTFTIVR
ncbi:MAG: T9SS type A sorting domain-containing protein [bacterium]|nr:T9SS type A sorting domain-containing protein [bacterium]MCP4800069.1 T9SS type A sorting domain-containing protein [bacterium]